MLNPPELQKKLDRWARGKLEELDKPCYQGALQAYVSTDIEEGTRWSEVTADGDEIVLTLYFRSPANRETSVVLKDFDLRVLLEEIFNA